VERRTLDQRADPGEDLAGVLGHGPAEQRVTAGGGTDQPEQHPDRGGLARPVRPEEPVHRAPRHRQVDAVDGDLAAEPLGEAGAPDRQVASFGDGPIVAV
jgi:hypothetical protein